MKALLGWLLIASLVGNVVLGTTVYKQDDLIDRQMLLIKSAQARAESRDTGGGIPVVDSSAVDFINWAKDYVEKDVICQNGVALVAERSRTQGSIEQIRFKPLKSIRDVNDPSDGAVSITCSQGSGYQLSKRQLSDVEVYVFATNTLANHRGRNND